MASERDIVERLRSGAKLPICPYDSRSPEYLTTPNDAPCKFCGGLPDGPDLCTGADVRLFKDAADEIERLQEGPREMRGLFRTLTPEQQRAALAYRGPENMGADNITSAPAKEV